MNRCKTCSPHEQYDATTVGSIVLLVYSLAVAACSMKPVWCQLLLEFPHVEIFRTLLKRQSMTRHQQSIARTLLHRLAVLLAHSGIERSRSGAVG